MQILLYFEIYAELTTYFENWTVYLIATHPILENFFKADTKMLTLHYITRQVIK